MSDKSIDEHDVFSALANIIKNAPDVEIQKQQVETFEALRKKGVPWNEAFAFSFPEDSLTNNGKEPKH